MSLAESDRNLIYQAFADQFNQHVAELVMELLFTPPTDNLATQADLHANTTLIRAELAEHRVELKADIAKVRTELVDVRTEVKGDMAKLEGEMVGVRGDMTKLQSEVSGLGVALRGEMAELRGELKTDIGNLYRWGAAIVGANAITIVTVLLA